MAPAPLEELLVRSPTKQALDLLGAARFAICNYSILISESKLQRSIVLVFQIQFSAAVSAFNLFG